MGFRAKDLGLRVSGFGCRVEMRGKEKEAPIIRLIMASLREIPTDLIVIAGGGGQRGWGKSSSGRFGSYALGIIYGVGQYLWFRAFRI